MWRPASPAQERLGAWPGWVSPRPQVHGKTFCPSVFSRTQVDDGTHGTGCTQSSGHEHWCLTLGGPLTGHNLVEGWQPATPAKAGLCVDWFGFPDVHRWTAKEFVLRSFPAHRWIPGPILTGCTPVPGRLGSQRFRWVFRHPCTAWCGGGVVKKVGLLHEGKWMGGCPGVAGTTSHLLFW